MCMQNYLQFDKRNIQAFMDTEVGSNEEINKAIDRLSPAELAYIEGKLK